MKLSDFLWRQAELQHGPCHLEAQVSTFESTFDCSSALEANKSEVIKAGGALFYHVKYPPRQEVRTLDWLTQDMATHSQRHRNYGTSRGADSRTYWN